jgi:hypothetical protein
MVMVKSVAIFREVGHLRRKRARSTKSLAISKTVLETGLRD